MGFYDNIVKLFMCIYILWVDARGEDVTVKCSLSVSLTHTHALFHYLAFKSVDIFSPLEQF